MFASRTVGLIWFSIFCAVLLGGCEDFIGPLHDRLHDMDKPPEETVDWVGTWSLESIDGVGLNDLFVEDGQKNVYGYSDWTFAEDGNWWASFYFEFTIEAGSIGGTFWMELSGTYALDGANYVLNIDTEAPDSFFSDSAPNTGTWRIEDNMLTLVDDAGSVVVFYRFWDEVEPGWHDEDIPQSSPLD